jgi:hypothetical protein
MINATLFRLAPSAAPSIPPTLCRAAHPRASGIRFSGSRSRRPNFSAPPSRINFARETLSVSVHLIIKAIVYATVLAYLRAVHLKVVRTQRRMISMINANDSHCVWMGVFFLFFFIISSRRRARESSAASGGSLP